MRPLGLSLLVVLTALLLERILRLFDLLTSHSGNVLVILTMAANLVPHYLGLALPAAFFVSVYLVAARLSDENELDAARSCGLSVRRIARPLVWLGWALMLLSLALLGYVQPYTRYAYRALFHQVTEALWDARLRQDAFQQPGGGYTVFADKVDASGRRLSGVVVIETQGTDEIVTTAEQGVMDLSEDRGTLFVKLGDATQIRTDAAGKTGILRLKTVTVSRPIRNRLPPFRPRGDDEREMTTPELWQASGQQSPAIPPPSLRSEMHARLVRSLSMPFLPMLAFPMGLSAKRARRGLGIALAAVILGLYHHLLQLGESLGDLERVSPQLGLWLPFILFAALCISLYLRCDRPARRPVWLRPGRAA